MKGAPLAAGAAAVAVVGGLMAGGYTGVLAKPAAVRTASCGVELWPVKTMADPAASQVDLTPVTQTVAQVNAWPVVGPGRSGPELRTYTVVATLTGYKLEADSDYHLVLTDGARTMIAEIPDPACASGSRVLAQITQARAAFEQAHPRTSECFNCLSQTVTLTGVGFIDKPHGQTGVAANAAELHPVIAFTVGANTVPPEPVTTVPVTTTTAKPLTACQKWPGRHWYRHVRHATCRPNWFTTP